MEQNSITLTLSEEELNLALKALSKLPFGEVYTVIEKIVVQSGLQLPENKQVQLSDLQKNNSGQ